MCRRDEHASACRDKSGAALPRPFGCKPRQDARFCKLINTFATRLLNMCKIEILA
jgi:hypothetical protein